MALNPADADLVVVAGPLTHRFTEPVERIWRQVPRPRAFVRVREHEVGDRLDTASVVLSRGGEHEDGGGEVPNGLVMADRGTDRDGLALDRLHVPLGPLLPNWPAGLVVHTTLQGDVIQHAQVDPPDEVGVGEDFWRWPWWPAGTGEEITSGGVARIRLVELLDALGRLFAVAGWLDVAVRAGVLRDFLLEGAESAWVRRRLLRLITRVRRSRTWWWLTAELGEHRHSVVGDVSTRCSAWLNEMERIVVDLDSTESVPLDGLGSGDRSVPVSPQRVLPELLEGTEFASARLIVASLEPWRSPDEVGSPGGVDD
ncbi:hypothetical protein SAMN04487819_11382 [Actinopolyspora alba]|uniref:Uncharacterized protein n=1 Tax=Actinopolyspora alba TaxID=673379 RepID=A0A1I2AFJ0_9ACTN|nr:hypothetical protein [Actinopolyspora alba]SFE42569.1 hypothetical protein SAMN04487819_11382 [Actinopolyspora alba]